jgi:hypothetical protein
MELDVVKNNKALEKYQQGQVAKAFRAERVGVPTEGGACAVPHNLFFGGNDPANRANVFTSTVVSA